MRQRLQQRLQAQVSEVLPGFVVRCEFSSTHVIDIFVNNHATHEAIRITGVKLGSLRGSGALDALVDQLVFEIMAIANHGLDRIQPDLEQERPA